MGRVLRLITSLAAVLVAAGLVSAVGVAARPSVHASAGDQKTRLDPTYGSQGTTGVATGEGEAPVNMALAPNGRAYLLQGSVLVAIQSNGKVARGFGTDGRVAVTPDKGEGTATGLALDSAGRIVVTGTLSLGPFGDRVEEAFVIRLLSNGARDATFGSAGEVDSNFGLPGATGSPSEVEYQAPLVTTDAVTVDAADRPIVGGGFLTPSMHCTGYFATRSTSFTARLTSAGALDTSFAGHGYVTGRHGKVTALASASGGGPVLLTGGADPCGARTSLEYSTFEAVTEGGEPNPELDPARPSFFMDDLLALDPYGRAYVIQEEDEVSENHETLVRLLPSGLLDPGFGREGGAPLNGRLHSYVGAMATDAIGRPIVAGFEGLKLMRFRTDGKADAQFGPQGRFEHRAAMAVTALAVDGRGRIYASGYVTGIGRRADHGLRIVRILPGE